MEGDSRNLMEGGAVLVVRASNIQEELQREEVYVEVAHEDASSGGAFVVTVMSCVGKRANLCTSVEPRPAMILWRRGRHLPVRNRAFCLCPPLGSYTPR